MIFTLIKEIEESISSSIAISSNIQKFFTDMSTLEFAIYILEIRKNIDT